MDIYRARNILSSKLRKKPFKIGQIKQDYTISPMDKPTNYVKYLTQEHQEFQQSSYLALSDRDRIAEDGQVRVQGRLEHSYTAFGLFVIKEGDVYHHETGVVVHSKYAIITYSHPFQLEQNSQAKFYPAINENSYTNSYPVKKLAHDNKNAFAMIQLDTDEDLSEIYGRIDIEPVQENRQGRQWRRGRGRRRHNDYRRQAPQQPLVLRYKILDGKIILTSIRLRQARTSLPEKGFHVQFDEEERMLLINVINDHSTNDIKLKDLKMLEQMVSSEPKALSCEKMSLTRLQCIWIAQRKWEEVTQINMSCSQIGEDLCFHLQNANWQNITKLSLSLNPIRAKGVYYLTKIEMRGLEELELRNCRIENEGCKWLSKGDWQHLKVLNIRTNCISLAGCKWLKQANWPLLKELNLKKNQIGRGCEYLATARWSLEVLQLGRCLIDDKGCKSISNANWPSLTFLGLEENIISNVGAKWLSKGNWKSLKHLLLRNNDDITRRGYNYLSKVNAPLLFKLSITNSSIFPQALYQLFKGDFPYLCKMNGRFVRIQSRETRETRNEVQAKIKQVTQALKEKYQYCRMQESDRNDEDW